MHWAFPQHRATNMTYVICNSQLIITQLPAGKLDVFIRLPAYDISSLCLPRRDYLRWCKGC